ncbi:Putative vesicle-associated membrane protein 726 [Linum perenne]
MGQQSLIYSFVARGTVILADFTEFTGNFTSIAAQCLQKLPASNNKFTYNCDGHTFNYLVDEGFMLFLFFARFEFLLFSDSMRGDVMIIVIERNCIIHVVRLRCLDEYCPTSWKNKLIACELSAYCVVAVESVGRQVPIAFLERVKEEFTKKYGGGKAATAVAQSLNKEFGPKLKEQMQYCVDHPEEVSKLAKVKAQVSEVKGVMMDNIEKVLDRGEKIELLVDKTENLRSQAQDFRQQGTKMRRKMWFQNMKIKLIVLGIIIALILIIVLSICGGFNCHK